MSKPLWLIWLGEEMPLLIEIWQLYLRRFGIDHWYRLAKQCLHWTLPKFSTLKQCERWNDLMPMITWELWLARFIVKDRPLPWQKLLSELTRLSSCSEDAWSFSGDWYTCCSQTRWKVSRLAHRTTQVTSYLLSCGQKRCFSNQKELKKLA